MEPDRSSNDYRSNDLQAGGAGQYKAQYSHHDNEAALGTSDNNEYGSNSINLVQEIIKKIKQKFKAGDVPFP